MLIKKKWGAGKSSTKGGAELKVTQKWKEKKKKKQKEGKELNRQPPGELGI